MARRVHQLYSVKELDESVFDTHSEMEDEIRYLRNQVENMRKQSDIYKAKYELEKRRNEMLLENIKELKEGNEQKFEDVEKVTWLQARMENFEKKYEEEKSVTAKITEYFQKDMKTLSEMYEDKLEASNMEIDDLKESLHVNQSKKVEIAFETLHHYFTDQTSSLRAANSDAVLRIADLKKKYYKRKDRTNDPISEYPERWKELLYDPYSRRMVTTTEIDKVLETVGADPTFYVKFPEHTKEELVQLKNDIFKYEVSSNHTNKLRNERDELETMPEEKIEEEIELYLEKTLKSEGDKQKEIEADSTNYRLLPSFDW